jgi:hypothetical protein
MRFSLALVASALVALVSSQATEGNNAFSIPAAGNYLLTAGKPQTFTWTKLSGSTVTLQLREGDRSDLSAGTVIVGKLPVWNSLLHSECPLDGILMLLASLVPVHLRC